MKSTKNGKSRIVGLTKDAVTTLKEHRLRTRILNSEFVFPDAEGDHRRRGRFQTAIWRVAERAGLPRFGPHRLRHTAASDLAQRGFPLIKIRDFLGHSAVKMVEVYARLAPQEVAEQAAALLELPAAAVSK